MIFTWRQISRWRGWRCGDQAHELCWLAEREGKGSQAQEALFEATYEKGENISDLNVLIRIGQELQLPDVRPRRALPKSPLAKNGAGHSPRRAGGLDGSGVWRNGS